MGEELKRWDIVSSEFERCSCAMAEVGDGDFVLYEDADALRRERDEAQEAAVCIQGDRDYYKALSESRTKERDEARAEVERLREEVGLLNGLNRLSVGFLHPDRAREIKSKLDALRQRKEGE